ncbi:hypothetical protein RJ55_02693 [Drechmeria coniospora]|nr:hypothetical protein RJ55_02693 [Drechmeria coniospora]
MATPAVAQFPSIQWVPGSSNVTVAQFPAASEPGEVDPVVQAALVVEALDEAVARADYEAVADLFTADGYWRDHLALTWAFRTVQGSGGIVSLLQSSAKSRDGFRLRRVRLDARSTSRKPAVVPMNGKATVLGIHAFLTLETAVGTGRGTVRLVLEKGKWKIFTLYTSLCELTGHEEMTEGRRPRGVEHGGMPGRETWAERRRAEADFDAVDPTVLVVGAGQAGLSIAARLKMLQVDTLVMDRNDRVGDNWRKRYRQLVLHDPVWLDHMPYVKFPDCWPIFTPKDKLAAFLESYADLLELNVWTKTELGSTRWDGDKGVWAVTVTRTFPDGSSRTRTLHPRHVVQATGHSGKPNEFPLKGAGGFKGDLLCHSSEFEKARTGTEGRKAVIVGCCNSALDIAQDYVENGYDVTVVQRSSTAVASSRAIIEIALKGLYCEDGPPLEDADMMMQGLPAGVLKAIHVQVTERQVDHDKDMLEGLRKAGFKTDNGPDESGLFFKYLQRGGGYYLDVGAAQLIADGTIKVRHGHEASEVLPHGLRLTDGSELEADEIILATGFQNMKSQARSIFGDDVADRLNEVWGFNEEGEWRTMWQRSGHPGFWFHGGSLAFCRYYSRLLALQIKGLEERLYEGDET